MTPSAIATESAIPKAGRDVSCCAVAAGVTSSANTRSAPVIWLVSATDSPSTSRNAVPSNPTGTPAARATSASTDAKNNGRAAATTKTTAADATTSNTTTWPVVMPRKVPKRSESRPLSTPW